MYIFQEASLPLGGEKFNPYVMLEIHYNNPEHRAGKKIYLLLVGYFN